MTHREDDVKLLRRQLDRQNELLGVVRGLLQQAVDAMANTASFSGGNAVTVDGSSQQRLTEISTAITENIHQLEVQISRLEESGFHLVLVPDAILEKVTDIISDHEITQRIGHKSQYDEIYDEVAEFEARPHDDDEK